MTSDIDLWNGVVDTICSSDKLLSGFTTPLYDLFGIATKKNLANGLYARVQ